MASSRGGDRRRAYLTAYYMWISVGGMIGGIATGLIAPHVFNWVLEYPLLLVLAVLCRPGLAFPVVGSGQYALLGALGVGTLLLIGAAAFDLKPEPNMYSVFVGVLLGLTVHFWRAPLSFAAIIAFLLVVGQYYNEYPSNFMVRNFFGVLSVVDTWDGKYRVLWHGSTGQGTQQVRDDDGNLLTGRPEMISEFFAGAGIDAGAGCGAGTRCGSDHLRRGRTRHRLAGLLGAAGRFTDLL